MVNNTIEFCDEYGLGQQCKAFAEQHLTFGDFWENCESSGWMFGLLEVLKGKNVEKLWEYYQRIQDNEKDTLPDEEYESWQTAFKKRLAKYKRELKGRIESNEIDEKQAEFEEWWVAYSHATEASKAALRHAIGDARWGMSLSDMRKSEGEKDKILEAALSKAKREQAILLREILGNPFQNIAM